VVRRFVTRYAGYHIVNLDALTYAGNLENLRDVETAANYTFEKGDVADEDRVDGLFKKYAPDSVIHLAAESHVDRSITDPLAFVRTNVMGTAVLLNAARRSWKDHYEGKLFYQVSTDEVYGSLGPEGSFTEATPYDPRSPYSASKAAADHFVMAYHHTYGLPVVVSNCSNNYGSHHFPEKLIPLTISRVLNDEKVPVYGDGGNVRDWLHVLDHCAAIDLVMHEGVNGEVYNVGGHNERTNLEVVKTIIRTLGKTDDLIEFVKDRLGHDKRYAIDPSKLEKLGWKPTYTFETGIAQTIQWYVDNKEWWEQIISGEYQGYFERMYGSR